MPLNGRPPLSSSSRSAVCSVASAESDSLQHPHGLWPTRLLCPWDSPGKNTGVGCHALLQGNLPDPGIELESLALAGGFFTTSTTWEASSRRLELCSLQRAKQSTSDLKHVRYSQGRGYHIKSEGFRKHVIKILGVPALTSDSAM